MRERLWVNAHQAGPDALRLAASLGVGGVRVDGNWPDLQAGPDQFTWGWLDALLDTCKALGLEVYVSLAYTPPWLHPERGSLPPLDDWQRFCLAFAQHFKGRITFVGCWNEFSGSPQEYVTRLLRPMSNALHSVDPTYQMCGPDLQTEGQWPAWLREMLKQSQDCLNVLTVHCYAKDGQAVWKTLTQPRSRWIPPWFPWPKPSIREVIEQAGWYGPTWLTETGWRSDQVGEEGQAQRWDQLLQRFKTATWPAGLVAYQLLDEEPPDKPPVTWGLFRANGEMKPAAFVLQRYTGRGVV